MLGKVGINFQPLKSKGKDNINKTNIEKATKTDRKQTMLENKLNNELRLADPNRKNPKKLTNEEKTSIQNEFGTVILSQPSMGRPTPLPELNVVINRHRHRPPTAG